MINWSSFLLILVLFPCAVASQTSDVLVPAHSILTLELQKHVPLRVGQSVSAKLIYPVYSRESLILPNKTVFSGTVVALLPDHSRRVRSRFNLDFTPFRIPVVRFTQVTLGDGTTLPIKTDEVADGAMIVHFVRSPPRKQHGFVRQQCDAAVDVIKSGFVFFVATGRGDRLLQLIYHQLPLHPQRIEKGTTWATETETEFTVRQLSTSESEAANAKYQRESTSRPASTIIEATLDDAVSSADAKVGQEIRATVAAPIFNDDRTLAIPQGATLVGTVTEARPARTYGRSGALRFVFQQVVSPSGAQQTITSSLVAGDAERQLNLESDSEGEVKPRPRDKIIIPALLLGLAAAPLNPDPGDNDEFLKNAGASNSLGLPGFLTGISVNSVGLSAGFGFYGATLSIYDRWIRRGTNVFFPRHSRVVFQTALHTRINAIVDFDSSASTRNTTR